MIRRFREHRRQPSAHARTFGFETRERRIERRRDPSGVFAHALERARQEVALVAKVPVERPVGDAGLGGHRTGRDRAIAFAFGYSLERVEEARARRARCAPDGAAGFRRARLRVARHPEVRPMWPQLPGCGVAPALHAVTVGPPADAFDHFMRHAFTLSTGARSTTVVK